MCQFRFLPALGTMRWPGLCVQFDAPVLGPRGGRGDVVPLGVEKTLDTC